MLGRNTETQRTTHTRSHAGASGHRAHTSKQKLNCICLFALANRNAKVGVKPTPAKIETTANPKRCAFGLSRKKSTCLGQANCESFENSKYYWLFLILSISFENSVACFSNKPGAAKVKMITGFLAASTSTLQAIVAPSTSPVPLSP